MKIIHISDISLDLHFELLVDSPEVLAKLIKKQYENAHLLLINVNYKHQNINRADSAGIALFKYLRLLHIHQHCVLYSFLSREQLIEQDPQNLIIFSEGVSFIRLPFDFKELDLPELAKKTAPNNLSAYFKAESRLPDDRHFIANWWGVMQLCEVHKFVTKHEHDTYDNNTQVSIYSSLNGLDTYQGLLARYLYPANERELDAYLKQLKKKKIERFGEKQRNINHISNLLTEKTVDYELISQKKELLIEFQANKSDKTWLFSVFEKFKLVSHPIEIKINELIESQKETEHDISILNEYISLQNEIEREQIRIKEKLNELDNEITSSVANIEYLSAFSSLDFTLTIARESLALSRPKILYVDDQASEGWAQIFQHIIYGNIDNENFKVIQPFADQTIEQISHEIINEIVNLEPELLILDLRLKGETGVIDDINNISGILVLNQLMKEKINCPVLITTASNKSWSFRETFALGASAYWIKEGLDDHYNIPRSVENYSHLVDLITVLTQSQEFAFLREFHKQIQSLESYPNKLWWETNEKISNQTSSTFVKADRNEIINVLWDAYHMVVDYLKICLYTQNRATFALHYSSIIIARLAKALEVVLLTEGDGEYPDSTIKQRMTDRIGPYINKWSRMLNIRNKAVHKQNSEFSELMVLQELLLKFLMDYKQELNIVQPTFDKNSYYVAEIKTIKISGSGNKYYILQSPDKLNLLGPVQYFPVLQHPDDNRVLSVGDKLKFKLEMKKRKDGSIWFSAIEATLSKQ